MILNCIIIDDDLMARESIEHLCSKVEGLKVLESFDNGHAALDYLMHQSVDLILLDIEMPELTGLEIVEQLPSFAQIIFTSSNINYAYDAFEYQVVDFLKKPLGLARFTQAIEKAREERLKNNSYKSTTREIYIREDGRLIRVPYDKILYFENIGDYVKIHTCGKGFIINGTMKGINDKLESSEFLRVHRSFIVNLSKIKDIEESSLVIEKKVIPISRANKPRLINMLNIL